VEGGNEWRWMIMDNDDDNDDDDIIVQMSLNGVEDVMMRGWWVWMLVEWCGMMMRWCYFKKCMNWNGIHISLN